MQAKEAQPKNERLLSLVLNITHCSGYWMTVNAGKNPSRMKMSSDVTAWQSSDIASLIASIGK